MTVPRRRIAWLFVAGDRGQGLRAGDHAAGGGCSAHPDDADAWNELAYATRKSGEPAKSIPLYQKALALDPRHLGAHEYIGEAYLALDDLAKAKEHLARLNRLCFFGCEEYRDLKKAVQTYEKTRSKIKPAASN
jgi:tetratricopeptide (TPR) repeat protein